jgi:hypothetical protein
MKAEGKNDLQTCARKLMNPFCLLPFDFCLAKKRARENKRENKQAFCVSIFAFLIPGERTSQ